MNGPPSAREEKELRALGRRREREARGRFLAEGVRVVEDLLGSGLPVHWALTSSSLEDGERGRALVAALERRRIPRRTVDEADFRRLAGTETPQGVLAVAAIPEPDWERLLAPPAPTVVLVLDAVQDPGNFGTLVRSAEALGASGVIALPGTVDPWNPKAVRSAVGSAFRQPIVAAPWERASAWLRENGFRVVGAAAGGAPVEGARAARVALVVGNEGAGLSPEVAAAVDTRVGIPLRGRAESLNVAAAAAILLHELLR